jgi:hypothetical protein
VNEVAPRLVTVKEDGVDDSVRTVRGAESADPEAFTAVTIT